MGQGGLRCSKNRRSRDFKRTGRALRAFGQTRSGVGFIDAHVMIVVLGMYGALWWLWLGQLTTEVTVSPVLTVVVAVPIIAVLVVNTVSASVALSSMIEIYVLLSHGQRRILRITQSVASC